MLVLLPAVEAFLLAFVLTAPFVVWLRPRLLTFATGATLVALGALVIEVEVGSALAPLIADTVVLVFIAPVTEELLKFGASGATGANFSTAAGAGIGFAATENAVYFLAAWNEPVSYLVALVAIRAATDPLLHATASTLSTLTWHGTPWGLPAAIALHASWNTATLLYVLIDPTAGLALLAAAGIAVLGVLLLLRKSPDVGWELSNDWRIHPWTGTVYEVG
ncbi:MAG TPA: PrsW family glutamic-type intramembrane protease [Thermoplasmata archaeon]|nr:PrsW family glutamic-type intramembrane protease [Thermoplasmata archaeon]